MNFLIDFALYIIIGAIITGVFLACEGEEVRDKFIIDGTFIQMVLCFPLLIICYIVILVSGEVIKQKKRKEKVQVEEDLDA